MIHRLISLIGWLVLAACMAIVLYDRWHRKHTMPLHWLLTRRGFALVEDDYPDNCCYERTGLSVWVSHDSRTWRIHGAYRLVAGQGAEMLMQELEERGV